MSWKESVLNYNASSFRGKEGKDEDDSVWEGSRQGKTQEEG